MSFENQNTISCSEEKELDELTLIVEIPNKNNSPLEIDSSLELFNKLVKNVRRVRVFGVGSLSLCYCANQGFDVYANLGLESKEYDYAAGRFILEGAEGVIYKNENIVIGGRKENVDKIARLLQLEE